MATIEKDGKFVGVEIDGYFVYFNDIDGVFIKEDKEGNFFVETDIYKLDPKTNKEVSVEKSDIPVELESKINAWLNGVLEAAMEAEKKGHLK